VYNITKVIDKEVINMSMGSRAENTPCSCKEKDKSNWYLTSIENYGGSLGGWVSCHKCHGNWFTHAKYIKSIEGSEKFKEAFEKQDQKLKEQLQRQISNLDNQIENLQKEKKVLLKQLNNFE
jgi:hypothetical protein